VPTLLTYVRDETGQVFVSVIADDQGVDYLFPDNVEPWLDEQRVKDLAEAVGAHPANAKDWTDLATANLGDNALADAPLEMPNVEEAVNQADQEMGEYSYPDTNAGLLQSASDSFDQVSQDYPDFLDDGETFTPEAMNNFVTMMLGPIDPDGPNGWILRAQDGNPEPGDENEYVHFPGEVDEEQAETAPDNEQQEGDA
jgi:hypothetical protein